jgi:ketosteroid isomerase-like protein
LAGTPANQLKEQHRRTIMGTKTKILVTAALLLLSAGCASHQQAATPGEMISSAKSLDASFIAAFNNADAQAVAATYWNSPDLVVYPPGVMECRGWQATHDLYAQMFKDMPGAQLQLIEPQYLVAGHDVIGHGRWKMTFPAAQPMLGRYTEVMTIKDGKWVYVLDHPSVPMPPSPPQPSR